MRNSHDFDFQSAWKPCKSGDQLSSQCRGQSCSLYNLCTKDAKDPQPLNEQCASWYAKKLAIPAFT